MIWLPGFLLGISRRQINHWGCFDWWHKIIASDYVHFFYFFLLLESENGAHSQKREAKAPSKGLLNHKPKIWSK